MLRPTSEYAFALSLHPHPLCDEELWQLVSATGRRYCRRGQTLEHTTFDKACSNGGAKLLYLIIRIRNVVVQAIELAEESNADEDPIGGDPSGS